MTNSSGSLSLKNDEAYTQWLLPLKQQFRQAQIKATVRVNQELLQFYWQLGEQIVERQQQSQWGSGFLRELSHDLKIEFPEVKGFSQRNLELIRQWYLFWSEEPAIAQQLVAQLTSIPWGHNAQIMNKCQIIKKHNTLNCCR